LALIDDDSIITDSLEYVLGERFEVIVAATRAEAKRRLRLRSAAPELALVDLGLPPDTHAPDEGFRLIEELSAMYPNMKVLVLSGQSDRGNIRHALTLGAVDFIPKPCEPALLLARLEHQLLILDAERQAGRDERPSGEALIGSSQVMQGVRADAERYAATPFPVLITGESGTGKELVARLLHDAGSRGSEPFVPVNCAALPAELLEAQLFGHARGAFTGATAAREGFFESAGAGTLFLDEVSEVPPALQPKLLRVLENGEFYRVGETRARASRARVVAATNRDLLGEIRDGKFRHDLYHRLRVLTIDVPPLRERGADRLELFEHFQAVYEGSGGNLHLDREARERWLGYGFPGNVRELRNIVIRLGAKHPGERVGLVALEAELDDQSEVGDDTIARLSRGEFRLDEILNGWEQRYITSALKLSRGNLSEAARLLGVNRTTLYSKIQRLAGLAGGSGGRGRPEGGNGPFG